MRRALTVGFLVGVIAVGVALCTELGQRTPRSPERPPPVAPPAPSSTPPPRPAPSPAPPRSPDAGPTPRPAAAGERALLLQARAFVKSDPPRAEALARESRRRFPDGATADERDALLVDALINQQRIGAARDETYYYFDHHPRGRFAEHLAIMTGVHPRPRGPGN